MKPFATVAILLVACAGPTWAADPAVEAPIRAFLDSFNRGDIAAAAAAHASGPVTIVDEVAPYRWHGADAFREWAAALDKETKDGGLTDQKVVASGAATRERVQGDSAYVILPVTYSFKAQGKAMREDAQMTFVLVKQADGWKIAGWTWTGPDPKPAN